MLERMESGQWVPVTHDLRLNSDEAALFRRMLDEKIAEGVSPYLSLYKQLRHKLYALPI